MKPKLLAVTLIASLALLCVAGTKLSRMTRTRNISDTSRFYTVTQAADGTFHSRYILAPDLATNLGPWITNSGAGGAATNAISVFKTNGATVVSGSTSLNMIAGTNAYLQATNTAGAVDVQINVALGATLQNLAGTGAITNIDEGNKVYVRTNGNNSTAARGRKDKPFLSVPNALAAAVAGDTLILEPGTHYIPTNTTTLLKNGVNWFLFPGAKLTAGAANHTNQTFLFHDIGGAVTCTIGGYGQFFLTNNSGASDGTRMLYLSNASSQVTFLGESFRLVGGAGTAVDVQAGTLKFEMSDYVRADGYDAFITGGGGVLASVRVPKVYAGGSILEAYGGTAYGQQVFDFDYCEILAGGVGGVAFQISDYLHVRADVIRFAADSNIQGTDAAGFPTGNGILEGTVIYGYPSATTIGVVQRRADLTSYTTALTLKGYTIYGPTGLDAIMMQGDEGKLTLDNVRIVSGANATNSIRATNAQTVVIKGAFYADKPIDSDIVIEAGTNFVSTIAMPNLLTNALLRVGAGGIIQTQTLGANLSMSAAGVLSASGGGGSVATDTIWDAAGDLVYGTGSDTASRLAVGTAGQFLQVNAGATAPQWSTFSSDITVAVGGAATIAANAVALGTDTTGNYAAGDGEAGNASTVVVVDGTDATSFIAIFDSATGGLAAKTDGALLYDASNGTLSTTTFSGAGGGLTLDASGFNGNLTTSDNTVQEVAQKLDDLAVGGTVTTAKTNGVNVGLNITSITFSNGIDAASPIIPLGHSNATTTANFSFHIPTTSGTGHLARTNDPVFTDATFKTGVDFVGATTVFDSASAVQFGGLTIVDGKLTINSNMIIPWEAALNSSVIQATNGPRQMMTLGANTNVTFAPLAGSDGSNSVAVLVAVKQNATGGFTFTANGRQLPINTATGAVTDVIMYLHDGRTNFVSDLQADFGTTAAGDMLLFHNAGLLTNVTTTGSGSVVRATTPTITTPVISSGSLIGTTTINESITTNNNAYVNQTLAGVGGANTNFTGLWSHGKVYIDGGTTNVNFVAFMPGTAGLTYYLSYSISNLTTTARNISLSSVTNRIQNMQQYYGIAPPYVLTNKHTGELLVELNSTNAKISFLQYTNGF
jgi:hypothetical protein